MMSDQVAVATKDLDGVEYREFVLGPFEPFTRDSAETLLRLAEALSQSGERPLLAFYPLSSKKWNQLRSPTWTTLEQVDFKRRGLIGWNPVQWIVGFDSDRQTFLTILEWAWRSSMCESLIIVVGRPTEARRLVDLFKDDWGDADVNDRALLPHFDPVFARTHEGNHLRISSAKLQEHEVRSTFARPIA